MESERPDHRAIPRGSSERLDPASLACPYCRDPLSNSAVVRCASCMTAHHKSCWNDSGKCSVFYCKGVNALVPVSKTKLQIFVSAILLITFVGASGWRMYFLEKRAAAQRPPKQIVSPVDTPVFRGPTPMDPDLKRKIEEERRRAERPTLPELERPEITIAVPQILLPAPWTTLQKGKSYEIRWINTIPESYQSNPNLRWYINIFRPNKFFHEYYVENASASSMSLTIPTDFPTGTDYQIEICLQYSDCQHPDIPCPVVNNNCYYMPSQESFGISEAEN